MLELGVRLSEDPRPHGTAMDPRTSTKAKLSGSHLRDGPARARPWCWRAAVAAAAPIGKPTPRALTQHAHEGCGRGTATTIKPTLENVKRKKDQTIVSTISTPIIAKGSAPGRPFSLQSDGAIVTMASQRKHRVCKAAMAFAALASRRCKRGARVVGRGCRREAWRPVPADATGALEARSGRIGRQQRGHPCGWESGRCL